MKNSTFFRSEINISHVYQFVALLLWHSYNGHTYFYFIAYCNEEFLFSDLPESKEKENARIEMLGVFYVQ